MVDCDTDKRSCLLYTSIAGFADAENETILNGFDVNEAWQNGQARMHDVRQAGFKIHALTKATEDVLHIAILRVIGQAVGTGHMLSLIHI